jgi:hypothetical protein
LLGNVRVHVARPVITVSAAKIALHRDVKPGDHRLNEFLVWAAAIPGVKDIGEKSVNELIGNSAHRILFGYPGWGSIVKAKSVSGLKVSAIVYLRWGPSQSFMPFVAFEQAAMLA